MRRSWATKIELFQIIDVIPKQSMYGKLTNNYLHLPSKLVIYLCGRDSKTWNIYIYTYTWYINVSIYCQLRKLTYHLVQEPQEFVCDSSFKTQ